MSLETPWAQKCESLRQLAVHPTVSESAVISTQCHRIGLTEGQVEILRNTRSFSVLISLSKRPAQLRVLYLLSTCIQRVSPTHHPTPSLYYRAQLYYIKVLGQWASLALSTPQCKNQLITLASVAFAVLARNSRSMHRSLTRMSTTRILTDPPFVIRSSVRIRLLSHECTDGHSFLIRLETGKLAVL
jgi:hypothetical protein